MSSRHTRSLFGVLLVMVFALSAVVVAPASAKLTKSQKAHIRKQLMRSIKKNPRLIRSKGFLKKASLVDFTLPVTIRVRAATNSAGTSFTDNTGTTNTATLDLGPSLGTRTIGLGGSLPAEIKFHDSFDGGGIGNVDLALLEGGQGLSTTSVPLLANHDVTTQPQSSGGCQDFMTDPTAGLDNPALLIPGGANPFNTSATNNPGYTGTGTQAGAYNVGLGNVSPGGPYTAGGGDVVLRTDALKLKIAPPNVAATGPTLGTSVGYSGGQANLFGAIPGKSNAVDVTANLQTDINSIVREVDAATTPTFGAFNCRQAWTGVVHNVLGGIHLVGSLHISPAFTADGYLRIAKATLDSPTPAADHAGDRVALTACLAPYSAYVKETGVPSPPLDPSQLDPAPGTPCNQGLSPTLTAFGAHNVPPVSPGPYTTTSDGSAVTVAGDLAVHNLQAEVLIGNVGQ